MKNLKSFLIALLSVLSSAASFGQGKTLIYVQDFDLEPVTVSLNSAVGLTYGNNEWLINAEYDGKTIYPNTPNQLVTIGSIGNIGTPNGNYLHVQDNTSVTALNANFKSTNGSVNWVTMDDGVCTYGFTKVTFVFWWTAGGSPTDGYGEIHYSIDGGATWTLATNTDGVSKYEGNSSAWRYSKIEDPIFRDKDNLKFAFKWYNSGTATANQMSFGVDDLMIVGEYDPLVPTGGGINAISITPSAFCHEYFGTMSFLIQIVDSLCSGQYLIEFSDSAGNFNNGTAIATFTIPYPHSGYFNVSGQLPIGTFLPVGTCYKYRINRLTPPTFTGSGSVCFTIKDDCPDTVVTLQPGVTKDPYYSSTDACNMAGLPSGQQPVCLGSVIDVPFLSYGAFNPGNTYALELSDSAGNFLSPPLTIGGPSGSTRTWDPRLPYLPPPPGSQSGKIPYVDNNGDTLPEGCNYFLRVVSSDPTDIFIPWGPFCLKHCDIRTNETQDITVCITNTQGYDTLIPVDINIFDPKFYKPGNKYLVQLLDPGTPPAPMTIVSEGEIGILVDTVSGKLFLSIPPLPGWLALGLQLKMYYMRIISTNFSDTCDEHGTLIRLTVDGMSGLPLSITINPDSILCGTNMLINFGVDPCTPTSKYIWILDGYRNPPLGCNVSANGANFTTGYHTMQVQEIGPGGVCLGPLSAIYTFYVMGPPSVDIVGDFDVCVGETVTYTVDFFDATYYDWAQIGGTTLTESNTEITITWTTVGTGSVQLWALGRCGEDYSSKVVNVLPQTIAVAKPDTVVCRGAPVTIRAVNTTAPLFGNTYTWYTTGSTATVGDSQYVTIYPDTSAFYVVDLDYLGCDDKDTIFVEVIGASVTSSSVKLCATPGDSVLLDVWVNEDHLTGFYWSPTTGMNDPNLINPMVKPTQTTLYTMYATFDASCPAETIQVLVTVVPTKFSYGPIPEVTIIKGTSTVLWASGGTSYTWTPSAGLSDPNIATPTASPDTTTTYTVTIVDANGCSKVGDVLVIVIEKPDIFIPNVFSPNGDNANDVLYVIDLGIEDLLEFRIFDRWGEVIFETSEIREGWDGTYKGKPQEIGTYVYYVKARTITYQDKKEEVELTGDVTLIR